MKKVFISGCYDILHGGHIQFFKEARALGDHLTVCFASDNVLWEHKKRRTSIPPIAITIVLCVPIRFYPLRHLRCPQFIVFHRLRGRRCF